MCKKRNRAIQQVIPVSIQGDYNNAHRLLFRWDQDSGNIIYTITYPAAAQLTLPMMLLPISLVYFLIRFCSLVRSCWTRRCLQNVLGFVAISLNLLLLSFVSPNMVEWHDNCYLEDFISALKMCRLFNQETCRTGNRESSLADWLKIEFRLQHVCYFTVLSVCHSNIFLNLLFLNMIFNTYIFVMIK